MENLVLARFMVRAFGLFLLAESVGTLPKVIYTLVTGEYSTFTEVFFAGVLPYFIPPVVGVLMFWNPDGMLRTPRAQANKVADDGLRVDFELLAISLVGLYWLVFGAINSFSQIAWAVMTKARVGHFFETYDAIADTTTALVEFAVGGFLVCYAPLARDKLLALQRRLQREEV